MGFRGYQVRSKFAYKVSFLFQLFLSQGHSLLGGDYIALGHCSPEAIEDTNLHPLPTDLIPVYPDHWIISVLSGPHDDEEFITKEGISKFYSTKWRISPSSNQFGIRLEHPTSSEKIQWARITGREGGSHPSNIFNNGYALGLVNVDELGEIAVTDKQILLILVMNSYAV